MLPRPALGIQGTASHGCPGAASLGGPFCPAGTILQMLWLLPSLMQVPVPAYPPTLGPHSALDYSQVQLAKRYCVGAARYARAERSNGMKTERYPLIPWQEHHWWIYLGRFLWNGRGYVNTAVWYSSLRIKGLWKEDLFQSQFHSLITMWPCRRQLNAQSPGFLI